MEWDPPPSLPLLLERNDQFTRTCTRAHKRDTQHAVFALQARQMYAAIMTPATHGRTGKRRRQTKTQ